MADDKIEWKSASEVVDELVAQTDEMISLEQIHEVHALYERLDMGVDLRHVITRRAARSWIIRLTEAVEKYERGEGNEEDA